MPVAQVARAPGRKSARGLRSSIRHLELAAQTSRRDDLPDHQVLVGKAECVTVRTTSASVTRLAEDSYDFEHDPARPRWRLPPEAACASRWPRGPCRPITQPLSSGATTQLEYRRLAAADLLHRDTSSGLIDQFFGHVLDQFAHVVLPASGLRVRLAPRPCSGRFERRLAALDRHHQVFSSRRATASVGCAPCASQYSARSLDRPPVLGSVRGL